MSSSSVTPLELKQYELRNIIKCIEDAKQKDERRKLNLSLAKTKEEREELLYRHKQEMKAERTKIEHLKDEYDCVQSYLQKHSQQSQDYNSPAVSEKSDSQIVPYAAAYKPIPMSSSSNTSKSRYGAVVTVSDLMSQKEINNKFERITKQHQLKHIKAEKELQTISERKQVFHF